MLSPRLWFVIQEPSDWGYPRRHSVSATYWDRLRRRVTFTERRVEITAGYLEAHHQPHNGTNTVLEWYRLTVIHHENLPQVYKFRFPRDISKC